MSKKIALVTGISGQVGAYLAKYLLKKNYIVIGTDRRSSRSNNWRLEELNILDKIILEDLDITETSNIERIFKKFAINEVYNLAAQSFVKSSFENPIQTSIVNAISPLSILEIIRNQKRKIKFYQASTSEMFGKHNIQKQNEQTTFYPRSPYATSKTFAHYTVRNYREAYKIFAVSGIYIFTTLRAKKLQQQMEESRKSEELEEARDLQLKLLAKKVPEMKNVEVETYIRTATEVGGDYYDFFELEDGTLIAACGDATGHGATSGMMVSITKAGLKGIQKRSPNQMLTDLNNIVKSVEIGRIRMSLNLLEFKNGHVNISSAAMPPVYHFSKKDNSVNEIELVGTPLGSFYDEEFDKYQVDFEDGDALVLMSDGLPEAPNHSGELLDYPAVKNCIRDNGSKSALGIKDSLIELSDNWLDGIQNPDDITLVIFKKKESGGIGKA